MLHVPCCWMDFLQLVLLAVLAILAVICILVKMLTKPFPDILNFDQEKCFKTSKTGSELEDFPSLDSPGSINLSVIVPAYNEECWKSALRFWKPGNPHMK